MIFTNPNALAIGKNKVGIVLRALAGLGYRDSRMVEKG